MFTELAPEHQSYALGIIRTLVYAQDVLINPLPPSDADNEKESKTA